MSMVPPPPKKDSLCLALSHLYLKNRVSLSRENRKEVRNEYVKDVFTALLEEYLVHTKVTMCFP